MGGAFPSLLYQGESLRLASVGIGDWGLGVGGWGWVLRKKRGALTNGDAIVEAPEARSRHIAHRHGGMPSSRTQA